MARRREAPLKLDREPRLGRKAAAAALFGLALCGPARAQEALAPQEIEARFLEALEAAAAGRHDLTVELLGGLPASAVTPRIQLERARSLFFLDRHREALALFREVYGAPDTPQSVKRNILPFMEAAELRSLRLRYGGRVVSDSNPSQVAEEGSIFFNGPNGPVELTYQPPAPKETVYGLEPWVSLEKLWEGGILTKLNASASLYEAEDLRAGRLDLTVGRASRETPGLVVQAGVAGEVSKESHYVLPSVEAWRRVPVSETARVGLGGQIGYLKAKDDEVSGGFYRAYAMGDWSFAPKATLFGQISVDHRDSRNAFYSYVAPRLEVGLDWEPGDFNLTPRFSISRAFYEGEHFLIGAPRRDTTWRPLLSFSHDAVEWRGFQPELTLFYERRDSNVEIQSYDQFGGYLSLRRVY